MGENETDGGDRGIVTVTPPAPEWVERLQGLYRLWDAAHAEGVWARDLAWRLAASSGPSADPTCRAAAPDASMAHDRFYVIPYGRQVAAALEVSRGMAVSGTVSRGGPEGASRKRFLTPFPLGIVHRVFTHPTMRRKGLARGLVDEAKRDFRESGGRMLLLIAPEAGPSRAFYDAAGFREVVRAADGEALLGWAARGRHVREALLRFLKHAPVRWRKASPGDWAALVAWSALPGGRADARPATLVDSEWIEVFERLRSQDEERPGPLSGPDGAGRERPDEKPFALEVGVSRHGYVVGARASGDVPPWLAKIAEL